MRVVGHGYVFFGSAWDLRQAKEAQYRALHTKDHPDRALVHLAAERGMRNVEFHVRVALSRALSLSPSHLLCEPQVVKVVEAESLQPSEFSRRLAQETTAEAQQYQRRVLAVALRHILRSWCCSFFDRITAVVLTLEAIAACVAATVRRRFESSGTWSTALRLL
jgi:hypothetical protein